LHGINSVLFEGPLEQLKHFVICKELLSQQHGTAGGGGSLLAGVDECKTETVLSIVSLLHSRIRTVTGVCGRLTIFQFAPCEPVFMCFAYSLAELSSATSSPFISYVLMCRTAVILTLAKWCSLSDVYGRKFLFQAGTAGIALYISINIFAATRFNIFGSNVYYLEAVVAGFLPLGQLINPAVFAYCGRYYAIGEETAYAKWTSY
jgi:hypothetical protein